MTHILVIEDEVRISAFVEKGLRAAGYTVSVVASGHEGLALARYGAVDLVVLDIGLPDMDGFELLTRLRAAGAEVPVIILTARDAAADRVAGLEGGANDYMAKPFSFAELLARIKLRLRPTSAAGAQPGPSSQLSARGITLDLQAHSVAAGGAHHELSAREFALMAAFLRSPQQVLSREILLEQVWGYSHDPGSNIVDVYVRYLRRKLGSQVIETVRGLGYRLGRAPGH